MLVLGLITCIVLRALSAQAKVVHSFEECKKFFCLEEPRGMDPDAKKICQKLENKGFSYATLYSVRHKIPLYSAYTLDPACSSDTERKDIWHLEPQISQPTTQTDHMVRENQNTQNLYKGNQAISSDYSDSGYDRGHLNPSSFQCSDGRTATFTLTNAAPMDVCFNRKHWRNWESTLRRYLLEKLKSDRGSATAYIVTGIVPDLNVRIPSTGISDDPKRVTVPSHIWTAVSYKHHTDDRKSLSFGYIGSNHQEQPGIRLMSVSELNNRLSRLFRELSWIHQPIKIFHDDCFDDNNNDLNKVMTVFQKLINPPVNQAVQMSSGIRNTYLGVNRAVNSDSTFTNNNNIRVSEMTVKLAFDSMFTYHKMVEDLKNSAQSYCLITNAKPQVRKMQGDLRKRELSAGSDAVECLLVSEKQKTAADGSLCSCFRQSDGSFRCDTGGKTKPCCSSPCLYQDDLKTYRCYSDQKLIECSPPYSLITYKGQRCLDDHPCAKYGEDYYWCKTGRGYIKDDWGYCSPPVWRSKAKNGHYCRSNHACAKYGENQPWCYTDDKGNKEKCCTSDDCYSAVNHKTCRFNHRCGYYGEKYLWCYTDDKNHWDYCCTNCG